jgi:predicted nucleic-acid-binding protein
LLWLLIVRRELAQVNQSRKHKRSRAVDTNVLVRLMTRDDARQVAAAEEFVESGACVSHVALAEATWVLTVVHDVNAGAIATAIQMLVDHTSLALEDAQAVANALQLFRRRPALGFSDCLLLEIAQKGWAFAAWNLRQNTRQSARC